MRARLLLSAAAALAGPAAPALAQMGPAAPAPPDPEAIIVSATRRAQPLADVPVAATLLSGDALLLSGATDLRQISQLAPSLLVSSTSSEAGTTAIRIRGIGTVGDNAGLEASVAVFIDGVYRSRSGIGLTELGAIERVEVLRGPQGTLFGRNASAGLVTITTKAPSFTPEGTFEAGFGNFGSRRIGGGVTAPVVADRLAMRFDGIWTRRDGFMTDLVSGDRVNDRGRFLLRGQLLFTPRADLSVRLIGDFARRDEACCAAAYLPFETATRDASGNLVILPTNPIASTLRSLGAVLADDSFARTTAITPGRSYASDVTDWGLSAEVAWTLGLGTLTSLTAYRDWDNRQAQDADFTSLDILARDSLHRRFRTFSQELRLQGEAGRLDWLLGAYFAHERLSLAGDLRYGADYTRYADALVRLQLPAFPGYAAIAAALGRPGDTLDGRGIVDDRWEQTSRHAAVFTHNVLALTDRLDLTIGLRYTHEAKSLAARLDSDNSLCAAIRASPFAALSALPCAISPFDLAGTTRFAEDALTGTAVLAFRPAGRLLAYASYARGYKAGGFNLDRAGLSAEAPSLEALRFAPEFADSLELGARWSGDSLSLGLALFHSRFDQFQLNTFDGTSFVVENIVSCRDDLAGGDRDFAGLPVNGVPLTPAEAAASGRCAPDRLQPGVLASGVEVEAALQPLPDLAVRLGLTYADTRYRTNLAGTGGRPLPPPLFNIPGARVSNAPELVQTGAVSFTPPIMGTDFRALFYLDWRAQSAINTGSDLFPEKRQKDFLVANGRFGLLGPDGRWSFELWAQNLLDARFTQVSVNAPLQGTGTRAQTARGGPDATTLFGSFLGEPRTFGITLRSRF